MLEHKRIYFISWVIVILGSVPTNINAVYKGDVARDGDFPFMVQILLKGQYLCGGAIIDQTHVMTSAQCILPKVHRSYYKIISDASSGSRKIHNVKYGWRERAYRKVGSLAHNDIGILTVETPFASKLTPLKLPHRFQLPKPQSMCKLTGWGACSDKYSTHSQKLNYLFVFWNEQEPCIDRAKQWWNLQPEHLCIEHTVPIRRGGAAKGDIGSPLSFNGYLVGIVTLPTADTHPDRPDIYTRAGFYSEFFEVIKRKENELSNEMKSTVTVCQQSTSHESSCAEQCSSPSHDYVCAIAPSRMVQQQNIEQQQSEAIEIFHSSTEGMSCSQDNLQSAISQTGICEPGPSQVHIVNPERYCVQSENVQPDSDRYYRVIPEAHSTVAQQSNVQPGDVQDFRCHKKSDYEDAFLKYLIFEKPALPLMHEAERNKYQHSESWCSSHHCSHPHDEFVCSIIKPHEHNRQETSEQQQNQNDNSPSTGGSGTGIKRPNTSPIHEVDPKKFYVASENVQMNPERYYRVNTKSYDSVAQQNNIQTSDVKNLVCRKQSDDEDEFIKYLLYGTSTQSSPQQAGIQDRSETVPSSSQTGIIPGFSGTYENPQAGSSSSQNLFSGGVETSPEKELDLMEFRPEPLPHQPDFTPPSSP